MDDLPSDDLKTTSTGANLSEGSYLDAHFEAMRPEYEASIRSIGIKPGWRVLDAGCGSGSFLHSLADLVGSNGDISALDLAPENIEAVETLVNSGQLVCSVEAKIGGVTSLPYEDNSFDAVWCANVTQYLTDPELETMLIEFRRVVRPGGIVAVKDFDLTVHQFIPIDPTAVWTLYTTLRPINSQIRGTFRVLDLPIWFKQAHLIDIQYKTTICERRAPFRPVEQAYLSDVIRFTARIAENIGQPHEVLATWRDLANSDSPDHIIWHPDFRYREGFLVTIGHVPSA
jgi:arsenite methyltransferase